MVRFNTYLVLHNTIHDIKLLIKPKYRLIHTKPHIAKNVAYIAVNLIILPVVVPLAIVLDFVNLLKWVKEKWK